MATEETPAASTEDWLALESACSSSAFARCLIELRDCFLGELRGRGWPGEIPSVAGNSGSAPAPAPALGGEGGLTVEQLAECLPGNAWQNSPEGYSRRAFARHLLAHPITGPRLRAAAPGADHFPGVGNMVAPTPAAAPAGGVTVEELEKALLAAYAGCPTWSASHSAAASRLLNGDPRIGPLLRGGGAARAEVARQQGEAV